MATDYERYEARVKTNKRILLGTLCAFVLLFFGGGYALLNSAAGLEREINDSLPAVMSAAQKQAVGDALLAWDKALPGLSRIRKDLRLEKIQYGSPYSGLSNPVTVTWLLFTVDGDSSYITRHRANGHVLRVGIVEDGSGILLQKKATQVVFLDETINNGGRDIFIALR